MKYNLILASQSLGRKRLLEYCKIPFEILPSTVDEDAIIGKNPEETVRIRARKKGEDIARKMNQLSNITNRSSQPTTHNVQLTTIILSADSGAIIDNQLIGKPKNEKDAYRIFRILSGKTHEFVTAVYILQITKNTSTSLSVNKQQRTKKNKGQVSKGRFSQKTFKTPRGWQAERRETMTPPTVESSEIKFGDGQWKNSVPSDRAIVLLDDICLSYVTFRKLTDEDIKRYLSTTEYTRFAGGYALSSAQDFITNIKGSISNVIGLPLETVIPVLKNSNIIE
jgi:predicted house-cleaning NTP pyrophosphatase (Maf/HAM1 superfamily)